MYEEACYLTKMSQKLKNHLVEDVFFKNLPVLCENPRKNNKSNIFLVNLHLTFFSFRFFTPSIRIRITTYADPHHLIFPRLTAVIPCRTGRRTPSPALNWLGPPVWSQPLRQLWARWVNYRHCSMYSTTVLHKPGPSFLASSAYFGCIRHSCSDSLFVQDPDLFFVQIHLFFGGSHQNRSSPQHWCTSNSVIRPFICAYESLIKTELLS